MLAPEEIVRGLVLHLNPDVLEAEGGTYTCIPSRRVLGGHFFLCLETASDGHGRWLPLYEGDGVGRIKVSSDARVGHPKWTNSPCYYHPAQVWTASHAAVSKAALAGLDQSVVGSRNYVIAEWIPDL